MWFYLAVTYAQLEDSYIDGIMTRRSWEVWTATVGAVGTARGARPQLLQVHLPEESHETVAGDGLPRRRRHIATQRPRRP
jgi:hypothetical protein